ncbi:nitroreductase [bacterium]|nr:nitroreductase [bacterium]
MSGFMELCLCRQSCRDFAEKAVEHEKLLSCVEAARLAPSACNSQPWSFYVVESPELVAEVAKSAGIMGRNGFAMGAKAFFVVIEEYAQLMPAIRGLIESQYFAASDIGGAVTYICLEAAAQGLGTCIMGIFDREKISNLLSIPKEKRIRCIIATGYASDAKIREKSRKELSEIAKFF